ncbi:MAG: lytic murein transglycosylase B [Burkholderiaceae bacterium]|nr:lytic murein transglycosylase B [Burkholderiaceae bacterium]
MSKEDDDDIIDRDAGSVRRLALRSGLGFAIRGGAVLATSASLPVLARPALGRAYLDKPAAQGFLSELRQRHGFDASYLEAIFSRIHRDDRVIELITPKPPKLKPRWRDYRNGYVRGPRVDRGLVFWARHADAVAAASRRFGVPEEILIAIIGVETIYGRYTGDFVVARTLATLAFDYPPRAKFFRDELEQFLIYVREAGIDPLSVRGSYAGAIGLPQFMPSSLRRYAVDFDGDSRIDLRHSPTDAIASVAHYLARHGWEPGTPPLAPAMVLPDARLDPLVASGIKPLHSAATLARQGVVLKSTWPSSASFAIIRLPNRQLPADHVVGTPNFYVITRYNRSSFYAMAVIELARRLRQERKT